MCAHVPRAMQAAPPHDTICSCAARIPGWARCEGGEEHIVEVRALEDPLGMRHRCALVCHRVEGEGAAWLCACARIPMSVLMLRT